MIEKPKQTYKGYLIAHRISESGREWFTCTHPSIHGASQNIDDIKSQIDRTFNTKEGK